MLDKYIKIEDSLIHNGQDPKTKEWYCKDLPAKTPKEADVLIGKMNVIYNKYNKEKKEEK